MSFKKVIEHNYCIGCGNCSSIESDHIPIKMHDDGFIKAEILEPFSKDINDRLDRICPFSSQSKNEDELSKNIFTGLKFDERVGFYNGVYTGSVVKNLQRISSSSGGLTTWFISKLFESNEIDSVIHVGNGSNDLFEYTISKSIDELNVHSKKKSRYYPVSYQNLVSYILETKDRILFVGIPCFVKSIRLLQKEHNLTNVKFVVSLLCGHMKSKYFAENIGWQLGIKPQNLNGIDFRVKEKGYNSNEYFVEVKSHNEGTKKAKNNSLLGSNWGHGFFKHKSCDFCDDLAGELADVSFGDAWLPKFTSDYLGTNIVVSRNPIFEKLIKTYASEVDIEKSTVEDFVATQAANYRHRLDGLEPRISAEKSWTPTKRTHLIGKKITGNREKLYIYRHYLSKKSTSNFKVALRFNSIYLYKLLMFPLLIKYDYIDKGLIYSLKVNIKRFFLPKM